MENSVLGKRDRKIDFTLYEVIIDGNVVAQKPDFQSAHAKMMKLTDNFADEIVLRKTPINMVVKKNKEEIVPVIVKLSPPPPRPPIDMAEFKLKSSWFESEIIHAITCKKKELRLLDYPEKDFAENYYNENFGKLLNPQNSSKTFMSTERAFAEKITKLMKESFPHFSVKSERDSAYVHQTRVDYKHVSYYIVYNERFPIHGLYVTPINICYGCIVMSHKN